MSNTTAFFRHLPVRRVIGLILVTCLLFLSVAACSGKDEPSDDAVAESPFPARYGPFGADAARSLARRYPSRYAGTTDESRAADYLVERLNESGYQVTRQPFNYYDAKGDYFSSENLIIEVPGTGFYLPDEESAFGSDSNVTSVTEGRFLIFGASYDTPKTTIWSQTILGRANGIHNNAAAVGALLMLAELWKKNPPGYDSRLILFGAGGEAHAGARAYASTLTADEIKNCEGMFNLNGIYAGNKVYAHAGWNSIDSDMKKIPDMRTKLYQATDVYYNNLLLTNNNFGLYTNQSLFRIPSFNGKTNVAYREWTMHESDHTPFDKLGIPIVFMESYEYDAETLTEINKESTDPYFASVNGVISGSNLDSMMILDRYFALERESEQIFGTDEESTTPPADTDETTTGAEHHRDDNIERLEQRVNNVAFILHECSRRGPENSELITP